MEIISLTQFFLYPAFIWQLSLYKVYIAWKVFYNGPSVKDQIKNFIFTTVFGGLGGGGGENEKLYIFLFLLIFLRERK